LEGIELFIAFCGIFRAEKSLHFDRLGNVHDFTAFFQKKVQKVLSFNQSERFSFACDFFSWQRRDEKSREMTDQGLSEFVEQVESALALDISI